MSKRKDGIETAKKATKFVDVSDLPDFKYPKTEPRHIRLPEEELLADVPTTDQPKLARCRSRSIGGNELALTNLRSSIDDGRKNVSLCHDPTPTPTPSPSPTAAANSESPPPPVVASIFINSPSYPPSDFSPCQHHHHLKRVILNEEIALPPELLATLIFGPGDSYDAFQVRQKTSKVQFSSWEPPLPKVDSAMMLRGDVPHSIGFTSTRAGTYRLQLGWPVGPRYADLIEKHTAFPETIPGVFYVLERETSAPGMPYGQYFDTAWRYCIRRLPAQHPGDKIVRSHVLLTGEVRFKKSVWRAIQSLIERNAKCAVELFLVDLRAAMLEECQKYAAITRANDFSTPTQHRSTGLQETPSSVRQPTSGTIRPVAVKDKRSTASCSNDQQRRALPSYQIIAAAAPSEDNKLRQPAAFIANTPHQMSSSSCHGSTTILGQLDQWLISHPQCVLRALFVLIFILFVLMIYTTRRLYDVEELLIRFHRPYYTGPCSHYQQQPSFFQPPPEFDSVLRQAGQVAGYLSESLATLAAAMRNNTAPSAGTRHT